MCERERHVCVERVRGVGAWGEGGERVKEGVSRIIMFLQQLTSAHVFKSTTYSVSIILAGI